MSYKDYRIKARLADIEKTQVDLYKELGNLGFTISLSELSNYVRGLRTGNKAEQILDASHKIICEWEGVK